MIKHTPGPWLQSHRRTSAEAWNTQVYDEAGRTIATLDWYPVNLSGGLVGTAREANARLIAAAPTLLEACKSAEEWLSGWASAEPYIGVIRAAILEAEGPDEVGEQGIAAGDEPHPSPQSKEQ